MIDINLEVTIKALCSSYFGMQLTTQDILVLLVVQSAPCTPSSEKNVWQKLFPGNEGGLLLHENISDHNKSFSWLIQEKICPFQSAISYWHKLEYITFHFCYDPWINSAGTNHTKGSSSGRNTTYSMLVSMVSPTSCDALKCTAFYKITLMPPGPWCNSTMTD